MNRKYTHIDLFSAIGGFSLGLKEAGLNIVKSYFSEIDKYAITVYKRNFPNAEYLGSVDTISGSGFKGKNTIITFGFPCQDLSVAGKRKGFDGSRSSLFFEAMRIVEEVRPSIFIFENVKGFYSSNNGKDFTIALQTIADLGLYECQWQLLNTAWFLPQNRERVYFVGSLATGSRPKVFPIRELSKLTNEGHPEVANCLQHPGHSGGNHKGMTMISCPVLTPGRKEKRQNGRRFKNDGEPMFSLTTQDIHGVQIGQLRTQKDGGFRKMKSNISPSLTARARQDGSGQPVILRAADQRIRRLTPIECERLQGFPDNWTKYGHEGQLISDTQRYKMCGNAVSVPVVKAIGEKLHLPI